MKRINWEEIKKFYKSEFGIDGWVVELFANEDILLLCASGASNETIATFTELPIEEVSSVISETFKFDGWDKDLPVNPYSYYSDLMIEDKEIAMGKFIDVMRQDMQIEVDYRQIYFICKTMWEIESKLKYEWK